MRARLALYFALAFAHALIARETGKYIFARNQEASEEVNILCGPRFPADSADSGGAQAAEIAAEIAALDGRRPELTRRVLESFALREEICELTFDDDSNDPQKPVSSSSSAGVPQFERLLLFATDGFPSHYGQGVMEHYAEHSQVWLINIPGAKYSHAIYTSFLTGQVATNYEGKPMPGDHLVRSMKRAGAQFGGAEDSRAQRSSASSSSISRRSSSRGRFPLRYAGPEWSFLAIFGAPNYGTFFDAGVHMLTEPLDVSFKHPYPFFFEQEASGMSAQPFGTALWNNLTRVLPARGESLMAHSGVLDHVQHGEHRSLGAAGREFPRTDRVAGTLAEDLKAVKSFIDANPEYLLVLISDHGTDEFDFSGYKMHGNTANGNEPFCLAYNPRLPSRGPKWIDIVDIAPTLSVLLRGVDIPLNALGIPQVFFGESAAGRRAEVGSLKQSLMQMNKAAWRRGVPVDQDALAELIFAGGGSDPSSLSSAASPAPTSAAAVQDPENLRLVAEKLKEDLYTVVAAPVAQLVFFTVLCCVVTLSAFLFFNANCTRFLGHRDFLGALGEAAKLVVIYAVCFLQLMFSWWNWGIAANGGFVTRVLSPALSFLIFHNIHLTSSHAATGTMTARLTAAAETLLFRNEMLNALVLFVSSVAPSTLEWVDGPGMLPSSVLCTALALFIVWRHYSLHSDLAVRALRLERNVLLALVLSGATFALTAHLQWLYAAAGFHVFCLPVYLLALVIIPARAFRDRRLLDVALSLCVFMHVISKDNPTRQAALWQTMYQFSVLLVPLCESVRRLMVNRFQLVGITGEDNLREHHDLSVTSQAVNVYLMNQAFFAFTFGFGDRINFDVHPFSGAIGMRAYDTFKAFSAFLMAFHKYGVFVLLCLVTAHLAQLCRTRDPLDVAASFLDGGGAASAGPPTRSRGEGRKGRRRRLERAKDTDIEQHSADTHAVDVGNGDSGLPHQRAAASASVRERRRDDDDRLPTKSFNHTRAEFNGDNNTTADSDTFRQHAPAFSQINGGRPSAGGQPATLAAHVATSYAVADHFTALTTLFNICSGIGFYLMYSVVTRHHPYQEATCTFLLLSFVACLHTVLSLWVFLADSPFLFRRGFVRPDVLRFLLSG